jgi:hypothetical protein
MNFLTGSNHVSSQANLLMNDIDGKVSNKQQSRGLMVMISRSQLKVSSLKDTEKVPGSIPGVTNFFIICDQALGLISLGLMN